MKGTVMARQNHFMIYNDLPQPLTLNIEPEGTFFPLGLGDIVTVSDAFTNAPVTIELAHTDKGGLVVSVWPRDGDVRVEKDGVDVLELAREGARVGRGCRGPA